MKKLAIIRTDASHQCPFGLSIDVSCRNVGDAIDDMEPLENVPEEQRDRYKKSNRRVYRHSANGERCKYADKLITNRSAVVCDHGDAGAGEHSAPFRGSTYYPRVFGNFGQSSLISSVPLGTYSDNFPGQIFDGVFQSTFASAQSDFVVEGLDFFEIDGMFEIKTAASAIDLGLPDDFKPENERYVVVVHQLEDGKSPGLHAEEARQTNSLQEAQSWAQSRAGPGKVVKILASLLDQRFSLTYDQLKEQAALRPDKVRELSSQELEKIHAGPYTGQEIRIFSEHAEWPAYLITTKDGWADFVSVDGEDFERIYRKFLVSRRIVWKMPDGTTANSWIDDEVLANESKQLPTAAHPTHKNPPQ